MQSKKSKNKKVLSQTELLVGIALIIGVVVGVMTMISLWSVRSQPALALMPGPRIFAGQPVEMVLSNVNAVSDISRATLSTGKASNVPLVFGAYDGSLIAFYGVALDEKPGTSTVAVTLKNGTTLSATFAVAVQSHPQEYLPVPAQLGGNSVTNQLGLVLTLDQENAELKAIVSTSTPLWSQPFRLPLDPPARVTDGFGEIRNSGAVSIIHEGTDFAAAPGTPVYAINAGQVKMAKYLTAYGNTVVIDHGLGVTSLSMHLSKISVKPGQRVARGQLVGYSGETGYSEGPHLHLSIKIDGISIDPVKFFALSGTM